jgi:ornithine cyclodeaminase
MSEAFPVVGLDALQPLLDRRRIIEVVRDALIQHARGRVQSPMPGQLLFADPPGDCHIKFGHADGNRSFVIKVATGFYANPARGLPANHGLVLIFDASTGAPRALLQDGGWLTAWRTAAATVVAASILAPRTQLPIGVVGTGLQARLALEWLPEVFGSRPCIVWGRSVTKARTLTEAAGSASRPVTAVERIEALLEACDVVVTCTPAQAPLFAAASVRPGTHIVALGADSPGKQELPAELFRGAARVLTDDHAQCLDHGDFGAAVRAGAVGADADTLLGVALAAHQPLERGPDDVTIVDLTGIAAEDIAIAGLFAAQLGLLA